MNVNEPKIRFKVVILPEWNNKEKGNFWEEVSADLFSQYDWKVIENIEFDRILIRLRIFMITIVLVAHKIFLDVVNLKMNFGILSKM